MGFDVPAIESLGRDKEESFGTLFSTYQASIYRYLRSLVRDGELAEDLAQDTFVKAYKALGRGDRPENTRAWLYTIATNTALSALRRSRLLSWLPLLGNAEAAGKALTENQEARVGERELIRQVLATLPKTDAACLLLRFQEDLSYEEIAEALGTSVPAAKMRVSRARAAFREHYLQLNQGARL
ncbi:MAG: sigma-70 family RNA polymerase sigma factor [Dehalococcoidales bacterium]|nr:sigma-70 family RNA polymerase sigma factor [Dehalococcoidales bacterium]